MVNAQLRICPGEWIAQTFLGLRYTNGSLNLDQTIRTCDSQIKKKKRKKKRTCWIVNFAVSADHREKIKESKKIDYCLDLARELKENMEQEGDGDTNCGWRTCDNPQRIGKGTGILINKRTSGAYLDYYWDRPEYWEEYQRDLRRLTVTQNPMRNHPLTLAGKTLKGVNNNNSNNNITQL